MSNEIVVCPICGEPYNPLEEDHSTEACREEMISLLTALAIERGADLESMLFGGTQ